MNEQVYVPFALKPPISDLRSLRDSRIREMHGRGVPNKLTDQDAVKATETNRLTKRSWGLQS